ncbi:MAG TPA: ATP-binding protein [Myxococcaceae bacterium]|jgi:signal transduction histidine kinase
MNALARRVLPWLVVVAPFLIGWLIITTHRLPAHLASSVVDLTGAWKVHAGDDARWAAPGYDDSGWSELQLPGGYSGQGQTGSMAWVRKRFELPTALEGRPLLFMLGAVRNGHATVFMNGNEVGQTEDVPRGLKGELDGLDAWKVDSRDLRPGGNVLAIRFQWGVPGDDGVADARIYLGALEELTPYYVQASDTRRFLQSGAFVLFGFMLVLLGTFMLQDAEPGRRALQRATFLLVAASALYLEVQMGNILPLRQGSPATFTMLVAVVPVIIWAALEFCEQYCLERVTRLRKAHRVICAAACCAMAGAYAVGQVSWTVVSYQVFAVYSFGAFVYMVVLTTANLARRRRSSDLVIMGAMFCGLAAGILDLLTDLYVAHFPRLSPVAISNLGLGAGVILIADFIKLSYVNKSLSASLRRTNEELAVALSRAEEVARIKSELLANVSHELRTPLNSIINLPRALLPGFVEQAGARCQACNSAFELEAGESVGASTACPSCGTMGTLETARWCRFEGELAEVPRHLRSISRNGEQLMRLINDVLDFSHLESGKLSLRLETANVSHLWEELREAMHPLASAQSISLRFEPVNPALTLRVDVIKFSQIFINLVGNALKFSPAGSTVELSAVEEGEAVVFRVRDQGIGIAPEHHQLIFESFRQVEGGHTRRFGGSGLGLSITRKLVELHQGTIRVESTLGQGACFSVRLPRAGTTEGARAA